VTQFGFKVKELLGGIDWWWRDGYLIEGNWQGGGLRLLNNLYKEPAMAEHLSEGKLKDGKRHGKWIIYYANGNKRQEGKYAEGKKEGQWTSYYKDGRRATVSHYQDDVYTGKITYHWPDGKKKQTGQFNKYVGKWSDGKKTGRWTYYAEDGRTVWRVITYKNGSRTKDDELPLGSCPTCDMTVESETWEACPKCGADRIEYWA
jgi:antitoxin component YwqK of YwqJK toxin-antitoxin module